MAADAKTRAEVAALGTSQLKIGLGNWGYRADAKSTKYRSPWPKWKTLSGAPLWRTGDKGATPTPQTPSVRKQLQRKAEGPASTPMTQTQLRTGEVINVSKLDDHGTKYSVAACGIVDVEETPPARFRDLRYPLWVVNAGLFVAHDYARCIVPKWLFNVMMLGKDVMFYGDTDPVKHIGWDVQRLGRDEKEKDPSTVAFYHTRLPVYSWMSGPVSTNMYQFDQQTVWIGTTSRWDKQVYPSFSLFLTLLSARALAHCSTSYACFLPSHLQLPNYLTY